MSKMFPGFKELDIHADVRHATTAGHDENIENVVLRLFRKEWMRQLKITYGPILVALMKIIFR